MSTVAFNATSAGALQFTIGRTSCSIDELDSISLNANITVFHGNMSSSYDTECTNWIPLRAIRLYSIYRNNRYYVRLFLTVFFFTSHLPHSLPKSRELASFVIPLTPLIRQPDTCFRWAVKATQPVCFGIDDVIVTNAANRPPDMHADFDPPSTADWLSLPGGHFHVFDTIIRTSAF